MVREAPASLKPLPRGRFVVLEGIDGCGKSTQLEQLRGWLPRSGLIPAGAELLVTREPGGTALGQALRQLLLHPPGDTAPGSTAELLLYAGTGTPGVGEINSPGVSRGAEPIVIADAFGPQAAFEPANLQRLLTHVKRGLIRVDADEVTYPAHVILR